MWEGNRKPGKGVGRKIEWKDNKNGIRIEYKNGTEKVGMNIIKVRKIKIMKEKIISYEINNIRKNKKQAQIK